MFTSNAFEVAIGLIFIYLVLSIICTGLSGGTAGLVNIQGDFLRRYIISLVGKGVTDEIYRHPLLDSFVTRSRRRTVYPSKIPPPIFALALVDVLVPPDLYKRYFVPWGDEDTEPSDPARPHEVIDGIREPYLRQMITAILYQELAGDIRGLPAALAEVYKYGTEIVADQVRRRTRLFLWFYALVLTIALNVNTTFIAESLWDQASGERIESIPIGWSGAPVPSNFGEVVGALIGWLLTAGAISFGADFWLGLLERLSRVRPAGEKDTKKEDGDKSD
jgi:hypothetical protein